MWAKNLLFLGLIAAGCVALASQLFPRTVQPRGKLYDPALVVTPDFTATVGEVDAAFRRQWAENGLEPAPRTDELTVVRRLSLGLTGTIPSLQEIRQLEQQPEGRRVQWWLAGTFEDRRFTDYLAERLARAYVGTEDGPFVLYRRRRFVSWLSDELARNRGYDEIAREVIASQGLWTDKPATNFVTVTIEPDNNKGPNPERLAGRVVRAFLGIRLDCAQCHDHPFEHWKQADFHGLAAHFGPVKHGFTGVYDGDRIYEPEDRKTGAKHRVDPKVPFLPELVPAEGTSRQKLAAWVTDPRNLYFGRATVNRVWALMFGRPLVDPVDEIPLEGEVPAALDILAKDFADHGFDLRRLICVIAATEAFQLDSAADHEITDAHEKTWAAFPLSRLRPEQVVGALIQAASVQTVNQESHILFRTIRYFNERDFVKRYGDTGEDEFTGRGGTIPQRLLLMNGNLVKEKTTEALFNAATQIGRMAPDDRSAVEAAYLAVLTRRPTSEETAYFVARLAGKPGPEPGKPADASPPSARKERGQRMEDLFWALLNSSEFSWNH